MFWFFTFVLVYICGMLAMWPPLWLTSLFHFIFYVMNKMALRPEIAHLSKQAKGQIHHLNKPDYGLEVKG